jgi:2-(1,2-epoxy-1,2-dihydrophenyl)acetyl-CoA isomerase
MGEIMMQYECLLLEKKENVAVITLNRPDRLNALNMTLMREIREVLEEMKQSSEIRALVVTGAGRGFCSGADIGGGTQPTLEDEEFRRYSLDPSPFLLLALGKPSIAAINGVAVGAGLSLASACDIRIASENASFGALWIRRGLIPDAGATYLLPRILGVSKALELMLTGKTISAREAERIGLVNKVLPPEDLLNTCIELAVAIAKGPPIASELTKRAVYKKMVFEWEDQLIFERYASSICTQTEDFKEGVKAFVEKREPVFRGR